MADPLKVTRLSGSLGAEVRGVSLGQVGPAEARALQDLLTEHLVLFFPDQYPTPEEHVAFARHFGRLEGHPHLPNPYPEYPEIFELTASQGGIADEWHSDITFQEKPSILAILHMVRCPEFGGDTLWGNMYKAYDELSAPLRDLCEGLSALHDASPHLRPEKAAIHPVVRVHPVTQRKSLFVNEHFTRRIVELSREESEMVLGYLTRWVSNPRFGVRYRWSEGTVAMWDNRCTQHFVLDDFEGERIIQRVTVMDDVPEAASPPRWEPYVRGRKVGASSYHDLHLNQVLERKRNGGSPWSAQRAEGERSSTSKRNGGSPWSAQRAEGERSSTSGTADRRGGLMQTFKTTVLADDFVFLEGPRWHGDRLWLSDMRAQTVYTVDESGSRSPVVEVPSWPSGLGFLPDGTPLVVSMRDRLLYKIVDGALVLHADLSGLVEAPINDMVVDDQGRAYIGNLGYDIFGGAPPDDAEITLVEADGRVRHVAEARNCPNGMAIRQDGRTLVAAESFAHVVTEFDRAPNGDLSNPRVLVELPDEVPDGICLDAGENVWVSAAMGKRFVQVDRSGQVVGEVDVSPRLAIACQLGGADGRSLFCLTYGGEMEDVMEGKPGARIEVARVEVPAAGSP